MFEQIDIYMTRSREDRRSHLQLDIECQEIGGAGSKEYRGLLAHFLKTTIPKGKFINLCHACNNPKCSNPMHLYWGTVKDNVQDQRENGTHASIKDRMVEKYGEDQYRKMQSETLKKRSNCFITNSNAN